MKALIVYAHMEPMSFTAALKNASLEMLRARNIEVLESDLYGTGFNPVAQKIDFTILSGHQFSYEKEQKNASSYDLAFSPDIVAEQQKLQEADLVIFHCPIWWSGVPAMMKGWFDRVLAKGFAWDEGRQFETGMMKGKKVFFVASAEANESDYKQNGKYLFTLQQHLFPITHSTLMFCGFEVVQVYITYGVNDENKDSLDGELAKYRHRISSLLAIPEFMK